MKIFLVAGTRPNFMKIAPIIRRLKAQSDPQITQIARIEYRIVHTGQHYDDAMLQAIFDDLEIPRPDYFLEAGSGSHAEQTAKIMVNFEKVCEENRPDLVVVVGDVNSTLACSIVAKKMGIAGWPRGRTDVRDQTSEGREGKRFTPVEHPRGGPRFNRRGRGSSTVAEVSFDV
jgi:UDP-N-acetylglucosamine 2-epimerase